MDFGNETYFLFNINKQQANKTKSMKKHSIWKLQNTCIHKDEKKNIATHTNLL